MDDLRNSVQTEVNTASVFMSQIYLCMTAGLLLTAGVAWYVSQSPAILSFIFGSNIAFFGVIILMVALPIALQGFLPRLSATLATTWFLVYSAVVGVVLSSVFIAYTSSSIFSTFVVTAGTFGGMSVYGMVTKRDLTSWGSFLGMGIWGLLLAMVVNIFLQSSALHFVISAVGVIIFTGLTAYDTQKLRAMGENAPLDNPTVMRRGVILGALTLYLDFINLFLMLLRLMGDRR